MQIEVFSAESFAPFLISRSAGHITTEALLLGSVVSYQELSHTTDRLRMLAADLRLCFLMLPRGPTSKRSKGPALLEPGERAKDVRFQEAGEAAYTVVPHQVAWRCCTRWVKRRGYYSVRLVVVMLPSECVASHGVGGEAMKPKVAYVGDIFDSSAEEEEEPVSRPVMKKRGSSSSKDTASVEVLDLSQTDSEEEAVRLQPVKVESAAKKAPKKAASPRGSQKGSASKGKKPGESFSHKDELRIWLRITHIRLVFCGDVSAAGKQKVVKKKVSSSDEDDSDFEPDDETETEEEEADEVEEADGSASEVDEKAKVKVVGKKRSRGGGRKKGGHQNDHHRA